MPSFEQALQVLYATDPELRANAAEVLGEVRDPRPVEPLIALLEDPEATVRMAAALAFRSLARPLIRSGDTRAVQPLIGVKTNRGTNWTSPIRPS